MTTSTHLGTAHAVTLLRLFGFGLWQAEVPSYVSADRASRPFRGP